jgi:L-ribulose-5-phosphate 3-epimerase
MNEINRRTFLGNAAMMSAGLTALPGIANAVSMGSITEHPILKSLKYGMIGIDGTLLEKFTLAKACGFDGVELDSPSDWDIDQVLEAKAITGLEVPGVVLSTHWNKPFNHPDAQIRNDANKALDKALHDCKALGGTTVLVVPAVVNGSMGYAEAYDRSIEEISRHVSTAEELGVSIAFENVWNNFLLSPIEASSYVDAFKSDNVGWYFDIGNIVNYGYPDQWIRTLGKRILKLDVKDFSRQKRNDEGLWKGFSVGIGDGDSDWIGVCKALTDIDYKGWASAEVGGGGKDQLSDIARRMDSVFKPLGK